MTTGVTIRLKGPWREALKTLDPRDFRRRLEAKLEKILRRHAELLAARAKDMAGLADNKPLTKFIKGRSEPGVKTGKLRSEIRVVRFGKMSFWVGVPKRSESYKSAVLLSEGAVIPVTDEIRMMFTMLWAVSENRATPESLHGRAAELWQERQGGWLPLKPETTHLVILPRRFMQEAWRDVQLTYDLDAQIEKAARTALAAPLRGKRR